MNELHNPYVFVVGCPRSGTTLLQRMLNAHPDLAVTNDTHFITRAVKRLDVQPTTKLTEDIVSRVRSYRRFPRLGLPDEKVRQAAERAETYVGFVSRLYDAVAEKEGKTLAGEKTPDYCRSIPFLSELFPWAHFVHIVRDGRDVALSTLSWAQDGKGPSGWNIWETSRVGTCALWWLWQTGSGIRDGSKIPERYQEVSYEDLAARPEETMRQVAERIGISYDRSMVEFAQGKTKSNPALSAKSAWLPPTPGLRNWRTQMSRDDVELFECIAGDLLSQLGFERRFLRFDKKIERKAAELRLRADKLQSQEVPSKSRWSLVISGPVSSNRTGATSSHDEALIRRDPELTGLSTVLKGDQFAGLIDTKLTRSLDRLVPVYVRYKPGTNCLVGYEAESGGSTFWLYAKAHNNEDLDKLRKAAAKATEPTAFGPTTMIFEEHGIIVRLFPLDAKLSALWRLEDDATKVVARLFDQTQHLDDVVFDPIRWKPERRLVLRMTVAGQAYAAVKFMTGRSFSRVWNFARRRSMLQDVTSPDVIGHSKRMRAIAYDWLDGRVLSDELQRPDFDERGLHSVAEMLTALHERNPGQIPTVPPAQTVRELTESAAFVAAIAPALGNRARKVAERSAELIADASQATTLIHGDFYAKQVLVDGDRVALVDFDAAGIGDRHMDLGNFIAHLRRDQIRGRISPSRAEDAERGFLESYGDLNPSIDRRLVGSYVACGLLKLAPHPFRFREKEWYDQTAAILEAADSYLRKQSTGASAPFSMKHFDKAKARKERLQKLEERALDREYAGPRITALLAQDGVTGLALSETRLLRRRAGRRCLIEYSLIDTSSSTTRTVLGKIREKGLDRRTFDLARTLFQDGFGPASKDGVKIPGAIGCIPELHMWLQECVSGQAVSAILDTDPDAHFGSRAAQALYKLHADGPRVGRRHTIDDELKVLQNALDYAMRRRPEWSGRLERIFDHATRLVDKLERFSATPIHRDFYPDQILFGNQDTYLVDLDLYAMGDPALDVGNFIAHVQELSLRKHGNFTAFSLETAKFLNTYLSLSGLALEHNVKIYTWLTLARHIWISTRITERNVLTEQILEQCESEAEAIEERGSLVQ